MRHMIVREYYEDLPRCILADNSLLWTEEKIPVTMGPTYEIDRIVGYATDLRREKDHTITAEFEWLADGIPLEMGATIYATGVKAHMWHDIKVIEEATIREVFLTTDIPWTLGGGMKKEVFLTTDIPWTLGGGMKK